MVYVCPVPFDVVEVHEDRSSLLGLSRWGVGEVNEAPHRACLREHLARGFDYSVAELREVG